MNTCIKHGLVWTPSLGHHQALILVIQESEYNIATKNHEREISRFTIFSLIPRNRHNTQINLKDRDIVFFISYEYCETCLKRNLGITETCL